jgi:hypothetical protein
LYARIPCTCSALVRYQTESSTPTATSRTFGDVPRGTQGAELDNGLQTLSEPSACYSARTLPFDETLTGFGELGMLAVLTSAQTHGSDLSVASLYTPVLVRT